MPFYLWVNFFDGVKWTPFVRVILCTKLSKTPLSKYRFGKKPLDIRRQKIPTMVKLKSGHFMARFKGHLAKRCIFKSQIEGVITKIPMV